MLVMSTGSNLTFRTIEEPTLNDLSGGNSGYPHGIAHGLSRLRKEGWCLIHVVTKADSPPLYIFEKVPQEAGSAVRRSGLPGRRWFGRFTGADRTK